MCIRLLKVASLQVPDIYSGHILIFHDRTSIVGTRNAGQDTRAEREEEWFGLFRAHRMRKTGLGLSEGGETEEGVYQDLIGYFTWHQETTRPRDFYSASVRLG